jgi:hypothetical protein
MAEAPRPRTTAEQALALAQETARDLGEFKKETRRTLHDMNETMGRTMSAASGACEAANDTKSIVQRLERFMLGEARAASSSHHDLEDIARRAARETAEEITDRHFIPPPKKSDSERVVDTIRNERNRFWMGIVGKIALTIAISLALLFTGMAIRDCQHGTVPNTIGH